MPYANEIVSLHFFRCSSHECGEDGGETIGVDTALETVQTVHLVEVSMENFGPVLSGSQEERRVVKIDEAIVESHG